MHICPGQGNVELGAAAFRFDVLFDEGLQTPRLAFQRSFQVFPPVQKRKNHTGTNAQNGKVVHKRKNHTASIARRPSRSVHRAAFPGLRHKLVERASVHRWRRLGFAPGARGLRPADSEGNEAASFAPCAGVSVPSRPSSRSACGCHKIPKNCNLPVNRGFELGICPYRPQPSCAMRAARTGSLWRSRQVRHR